MINAENFFTSAAVAYTLLLIAMMFLATLVIWTSKNPEHRRN